MSKLLHEIFSTGDASGREEEDCTESSDLSDPGALPTSPANPSEMRVVDEQGLRDAATEAMTDFVESDFIMKQNEDGTLSEQYIKRNDAIAMGWQVFYATMRFLRPYLRSPEPMPSQISGTTLRAVINTMEEMGSGAIPIHRGVKFEACQEAARHLKILSDLLAGGVREPVSVVRCAMALQGNERIKLGSDLHQIAKAVLEAAGVKYVD